MLRTHRVPTRRLTSAAAALLTVPLLALASAAPSSADADDPYAAFEHCPVQELVDSGHPDGACITAVVRGGTFTIGKGTVPVTAESTLSVGTYVAEDGTNVNIAPADGTLFTSSPMQVPGGLLGVAGLEGLLPGLTDIRATVELATDQAPEVNVLNAIFGGVVVELPIKIRLQNPLLGNRCYIGTDANPIVLELTTGTTSPPAPNQPIGGDTGTFEFVPGPNGGSYVKGTGATLVDNAFSVPAATGCGVLGTLNSVVNQRQGLPAAAGTNTAVLQQDSFLGGPASAILASRG